MRTVTFRVPAREGQIVVPDGEGHPYTVLHCNASRHADMKLVLSFNQGHSIGDVGDCIVRPREHEWGMFETQNGFVLMRSDFHVGWLFWGGCYPNGKSIKPCVRFDEAIEYKTKAEAMVALAVLNVDKKKEVNCG